MAKNHPRVRIFGIRHHGPGSTQSLLRALREFEPDCLLIEGPADAEGLLPYVENEGLRPPVSILIYNPKLLTQAAYIPFAAFSPEWQAIKFGLKKQIPVRFMDLPMNLQFTLDAAENRDEQLKLEVEKHAPEALLFRKDPIGHIARLAGYTDSERWWEVTFEQTENEADIFQAILDMMTALRNDEAHLEPAFNLRREAFMRKTIRKAAKDGFANIAVVCGAWHAPALADWVKIKQSADNAILKGLKKTTTRATWVPWSYDRLSSQSGYGAGVASPAWYDLLFQNRAFVTMRWMVKVARLFRKEDLDASAAHAIEAVRLAETLATLRGLSLPGLDELKAAAVSIFCEGDPAQLALIEEKLIVGHVVGKVPPEIPAIPLQQDLLKKVKTARLSAYWENTEELWLKANASNPQGGIDLREEKDRMKSELLHRLNLLGIPWGREMKGSQYDTGSFKEYWKLKWKPDFAVKIIEAGMWGNTVEEAAENLVRDKANSIQNLPELTALVGETLKANLSRPIDFLVEKMRERASLTTDIYHLMDALPGLVRIIRYGNARRTETRAVEEVVGQMVPRVCIGLLGACAALDEAAAREAFLKIVQTNQALGILNHPDYDEQWAGALESVSRSEQVNGLLSGACTRILFDKNNLDSEAAGTRMHYELSKGAEVLHAAQWIEGFLHGSGLLLIHNPELWTIVDEWVNELKPDDFKDVLPLLRRTFSRFSKPEKEKMLDLAKATGARMPADSTAQTIDPARAQMVLPTVRTLLGMT
ncbi:MAG: hypothetical protein D6714_20525 [Bacteroidetes bacterium]|nr:MAG: hypothetical protein D6714_20525 [Bacteroidota bacterium]